MACSNIGAACVLEEFTCCPTLECTKNFSSYFRCLCKEGLIWNEPEEQCIPFDEAFQEYIIILILSAITLAIIIGFIYSFRWIRRKFRECRSEAAARADPPVVAIGASEQGERSISENKGDHFSYSGLDNKSQPQLSSSTGFEISNTNLRI